MPHMGSASCHPHATRKSEGLPACHAGGAVWPQALLVRFPADMHPAFQGDTVMFFGEQLAPKLNALR